MFCVIGTEDETGGDGAGEVSTGIESESVVRSRRVVVTRRLLLTEGPSIVILWPTRARIGIASYWRRHSMGVYFVPKVYYSSITPHLPHVADSCFPVLDQYSGHPLSAVIQATGHQLVSVCSSLVEEEEKNQLKGILMTS